MTRPTAQACPRNAYVLQRLFGSEAPRAARRPTVEKKLIGHVLTQAIRLHADLQEIARVAKDGRAVAPLLKRALNELVIIRSALFKAMGRKP